MSVFWAFSLNIALYSIIPLYFSTMNTQLRVTAFYCYISLILLVGGLAGAIYSFPISEKLHISGGNMAYGAFMMSTVMLIIIERNMSTFRNIIRLVVIVDIFVFLGFNFLSWVLKSGIVLNPFQIPPEIFDVSLWMLILGGILILGEVLLLLLIFLQIRKFISSLTVLAFIYTVAFFLILCLDGVLFPLIAFGLSPELVSIIVGNVSGKIVLASGYSVPMLLFYWLFRRSFSRFLKTPLAVNELVRAPRKQLLETLYHYEARDQQLQRDNQALTEAAEHDKLTALANRRKFDQTLEAEWTRCKREQSPLTLVIGDIDFFKQYNDTYGHQQGDICLQMIATSWGNIVKKPTDLAARIGGEEFAIISPDTQPDQILESLQHFLLLLQERPIPHGTSAVASHVTMSIGVAGCVPQRGASPNDLFVAADQHLYTAKHAGRNCIIVE